MQQSVRAQPHNIFRPVTQQLLSHRIDVNNASIPIDLQQSLAHRVQRRRHLQVLLQQSKRRRFPLPRAPIKKCENQCQHAHLHQTRRKQRSLPFPRARHKYLLRLIHAVHFISLHRRRGFSQLLRRIRFAAQFHCRSRRCRRHIRVPLRLDRRRQLRHPHPRVQSQRLRPVPLRRVEARHCFQSVQCVCNFGLGCSVFPPFLFVPTAQIRVLARLRIIDVRHHLLHGQRRSQPFRNLSLRSPELPAVPAHHQYRGHQRPRRQQESHEKSELEFSVSPVKGGASHPSLIHSFV